MIKIVPKFTRADIERIVKNQKQRIEAAILSVLQKIGEEFVSNARENGSYKDHTGNLRNSIGYIIIKDGQQLFDNFRKSAKVKATIKSGKNKGKEKITSGDSAGLQAGRELAEQVAQRHPKGFVLICVAGMEYAGAVESHGFDVITSSSQVAERDLKAAIVRIASKIQRAA